MKTVVAAALGKCIQFCDHPTHDQDAGLTPFEIPAYQSGLLNLQRPPISIAVTKWAVPLGQPRVKCSAATLHNYRVKDTVAFCLRISSLFSG
jgi:hypothetical protein